MVILVKDYKILALLLSVMTMNDTVSVAFCFTRRFGEMWNGIALNLAPFTPVPNGSNLSQILRIWFVSAHCVVVSYFSWSTAQRRVDGMRCTAASWKRRTLTIRENLRN